MKILPKIPRTIHSGRTARRIAFASLAALLSAAPFQAAFAQTAPSLGAAGGFAVLSGTAVTCTDSTVTGDVGSAAAAASVVQTNCTINGTVHAGDTSALAAHADFLGAHAALAALPATQCDAVLTGTLDTVILPPGIYCFDAAATLTGQLTLDGPASGIWIFRIGTAGTGALTATNFSVVMAGGGQACNVYWWVAEASTLTTSNFQGTILAGAASTVTGGTLIGRDLAKAAVTMTGATVSSCSAGTPPADDCKDTVTGGGWITLPRGTKGTFSVTAGTSSDRLWGSLTFQDHGAARSSRNVRALSWRSSGSSSSGGTMVKGTGVTSYTVVDAMTRHIEGTAEINGQAGFTYQIDVVDRGRGLEDTFSIELSNGYTASGTLIGGNVKVKEKCRPAVCVPFDDDDDGHDGGHDDKDGKDGHEDRSRVLPGFPKR